MATYTSIINSVLRRLRENTIASPGDSDYSLLIGDLVNETKREVEDAWKWTALRSTKTVATVAGTAQYAITDASKRFKLQDTENSVYNATQKYWLSLQPSAWMKQKLIENTDQAQPSHYYFEGFDSNGDPYVNFYAIPDAVYTINFNLVIPQDDFSVGTETLSVPDYPVILGTYAKAIAERGEDDGRAHGEALGRYQQALSDTIALDESLTTGETTWYA